MTAFDVPCIPPDGGEEEKKREYKLDIDFFFCGLLN